MVLLEKALVAVNSKQPKNRKVKNNKNSENQKALALREQHALAERGKWGFGVW